MARTVAGFSKGPQALERMGRERKTLKRCPACCSKQGFHVRRDL